MELIINKNIHFDEATHTYTNKDGVLLTGVTSVMKEMGVSPDFGDVPQATLDAAAHKGTLVHQAIEDWCEMQRTGVIDENRFAYEEDFVLEALEGYKKLGINAIANEYLVSDNENIATFIDLVVATDKSNEVDLKDIKYTWEVHSEALSWQLSLCKYLFELQNPHLKVRNLSCVHLKNETKDIPVREIPADEVAMFLNCFLAGLPYTPSSLVPTAEQKETLRVLVQLEAMLVEMEAETKKIEEKKKKLVGGILQLMKDHNLKKWEPTPNIAFAYVAPQERTGVDAKLLAEKEPEIFEKYKKISRVKESLRITIK